MSVVAKQVRDYMRSVGKNQNHFTRQPTNLNQKHNLYFEQIPVETTCTCRFFFSFDNTTASKLKYNLLIFFYDVAQIIDFLRVL